MIDPIAENIRELFTKRGLEAYRKVPGNRAHALSLAELHQLGAFALAYRDIALENGQRFEMADLEKHFEQLALDLPGLTQNRPDPEGTLTERCAHLKR